MKKKAKAEKNTPPSTPDQEPKVQGHSPESTQTAEGGVFFQELSGEEVHGQQRQHEMSTQAFLCHKELKTNEKINSNGACARYADLLGAFKSAFNWVKRHAKRIARSGIKAVLGAGAYAGAAVAGAVAVVGTAACIAATRGIEHCIGRVSHWVLVLLARHHSSRVPPCFPRP
jgi:hypothetical protein